MPAVITSFGVGVPFEFGKRLERLSDEMLVEVAERRILLGEDVGRELIAIGVGPVIPGAGAENAPFGFLAHDQRYRRRAGSR